MFSLFIFAASRFCGLDKKLGQAFLVIVVNETTARRRAAVIARGYRGISLATEAKSITGESDRAG
jgi:hypothetical protein